MIKNSFMRVTIEILDAELEILETSKSRCHSLGSLAEVYLANVNYTHNRNVLYLTNSMSKFTIIFHF